MIRILHIVPSLDINAGMMSVIMNDYRYLNRDKIQFDFLYLFDSEHTYCEEIHSLGGRVFTIGRPSFRPSGLREVNHFFAAHEGEFSAIHCHPIWTPALFALPAKHHGVKHVIAHSHSTKFSEKKRSAIRNRCLMPFIRRLATDYMACSADAAGLFGLRDPGRVYILYNSIPVEKYLFCEADREEIRKLYGVEEDALLIGHIGRFSAEKNHSFLLHVFRELLLCNDRARLMLVGDGPLFSRIQKEAATLGLSSRVIFTGVRRDVEKLLFAMDIFVLPSRFEGVPVVAIEAQASGLPCVISDTVTKKIAFGDCTFVPVNAGVTPWLEALNRARDRQIGAAGINQILAESCYNAHVQASRLENYYLSLVN